MAKQMRQGFAAKPVSAAGKGKAVAGGGFDLDMDNGGDSLDSEFSRQKGAA